MKTIIFWLGWLISFALTGMVAYQLIKILLGPADHNTGWRLRQLAVPLGVGLLFTIGPLLLKYVWEKPDRAFAMTCLPAAGAGLYGIFILLVILGKPRWN